MPEVPEHSRWQVGVEYTERGRKLVVDVPPEKKEFGRYEDYVLKTYSKVTNITCLEEFRDELFNKSKLKSI